MKKMMITWAKCDERATVPTKRDEDACVDIYAIYEEDQIILNPLDIHVFSTGLKFACSDDWYPQIHERGSTGIIGLSYRAGVFDSGFRNEWKIILNNTSNKTIIIYNDNKFEHIDFLENLEVEKSDYVFYPMSKAIAQASFNYVPKYEYAVIEEEDLAYFSSERGNGMLGSTNK